MPDLLREQFPYFRPIVEAFGYRNLEFEGWEADDVIATLATQADEAGIKTTVVSTDRDAFQLVSENVALMMTPRGVSDVHVYTPERVEARYGIRPEQVPDFIGLKGDTSDNIPGVPGIGDKTAGQLIAQYGSLEEVIAHAEELSPARKKNIPEHAEQARQSKELATMRRDLELDCDVTQLVLAPPDRSQLKEMFRQFEFRNLLHRVDELDAAVPAAPMQLEKTAVPWREELSNSLLQGGGGWRPCGDDEERSRRRRGAVVVSPEADVSTGRSSSTTRRRSASRRRTTRCSLAYLIEPSRPEYPLDELEPSTGSSSSRSRGRRGDRGARPPRRRDAPAARPAARARRERDMEPLYRDVELPLSPVLAAMEDAGVKIDEYRMGEITARLRERVEELEARAYELAGEEFMLGSTQQVGRILFEKLELTPGRKGKTGLLDGHAVLRSIRGEHEIVAVIEEWREYSKLLNTYLGPLPSLIAEDGRLHTTFNQAVAATGRLSTTNPNLQAIPIRTELGREIRSAFVAEPGHKLLSADYSQIELRILAHVSGEPKLREAFARGEDIHTATAAEVLGVDPADADDGRALGREDDQLRDRLRDLGVRALREPRDPARGGAGVHRRLPRAVPARAGLHPAHDRAGRARRLRDEPAGPAAAGAGAARVEPADALARGAARRQLRHAGLERGHHQGRDGAHPRPAARGGERRALVLQVHDELLLEVPDAEVSAVKELVREEMCGAYDLDPPLAVDIGTGDDWHEAPRLSPAPATPAP